MSGMTDNITRKKNTGEPTSNGGEFGSKKHDEAEAVLLPASNGPGHTGTDGAKYPIVDSTPSSSSLLDGASDVLVENVVENTADEAGLPDNRWLAPFIKQVNSKWQVAAILENYASYQCDASSIVGSDLIAGEAQVFPAFRFPAGWRCTQLLNSKLPAKVKQLALASMRALP